MTWKQALKGSIKKWDKICFEGGLDLGADNCALCKKDNDRVINCSDSSCPNVQCSECHLRLCYRCPISMATGEPDCAGTPYGVWRKTDDGAIHEYLFLCMLYHEYYG